MKCNICGAPRKVFYKEKDKETGEIKERSHTVKCLGHDVHYSLWNMHPEYTKWKKYLTRAGKRTNGSFT